MLLMGRRVADEEVFEAAIAVMVERGYTGATTKQIAEAAGINEVTLFRRYGTKARLLRAALLAEVEAFGGPQGVRHTGDVAADLERVVDGYLTLLRRRGRLIPLILAELPRHDELAEVVEVPQRLLMAVGAMIARYQHDGVLRVEPPMQSVAALLGPLFIPALLGDHAPDEVRSATVDPARFVSAFLDGRRR